MRPRLIIVLVLPLLTLARIGSSQQVDGSLEGRILAADGTPLPDVSVAVHGPRSQVDLRTATDAHGYFRIPGLPVGSYTISMTHVAHHPMTLDSVIVHLGRATVIRDVRLQSQVLQLPEVVVRAPTPALDATSAAIGTNLPAREFETLPTDRNFRSMVALAPQANASYFGDEANLSGGTGAENVYFIDGIHVTDPYFADGSTNLPYNFVQEIQIKSGGYEAEYGRALGGIVNVITPSGGNEFHGEAFGFFTNSQLAAERRRGLSDAGVGDYSQFDVGGSVSGPVVRDRLWFFAAYNPGFDRADVDLPGVSSQEATRALQLFAGKLTWQAASRTNLALTVLGDPGKRHSVGPVFGFLGRPSSLANPDPLLSDVEEGGMDVSIRGTHQLGKKVLLRASVSHFNRKLDRNPLTERGASEPLLEDLETGTWSGGYGGSVRDHGERTSAALSGAAFLGRHSVKVGVEYEDNALDDATRMGAGTGGQGFIFRASNVDFSWLQIRSEGTVHNRIPTAYLQDSWRLADRLRLNLGLRWNAEYLIASDGNVAQEITDEWQPRCGFTYQIREGGSQQIVGSYGRFYEQIPNALGVLYYSDAVQRSIHFTHDPRLDPSGGDTTFFTSPGPAIRNVSGLRGEYFDEYTLGYERGLSGSVEVGVRGIYRTLLSAIEDASSPQTGTSFIGNPGRGTLAFLPDASREYTALEVTARTAGERRTSFLASYVLSRNYGNYTGLVATDIEFSGIGTNANPQFDFIESVPNSKGWLPNDRTHVFKFSGAYRSTAGFSAGTSFLWASGTPLSELGGIPVGPPYVGFMRQRGSVGRSPAIWDWNLRLAQTITAPRGVGPLKPKLTLDLLHVLSGRKAVLVDQRHFFNVDANGLQLNENPNYLRPLIYQPPMAARLGITVGF